MKLLRFLEPAVLIFIFFTLLGILSYKLENTALTSYDEAWYAEISRNLAGSKNIFELEFNGARFTDHPPFGFFLMAIASILFSSNEFSVRITSVVLGSAAIILIYLIGKEMNSRIAGVSAACILFSSLWFLLRVRSGNLDVSFLFFEVLTVYFLLSSKKKFLFLVPLSFAALFLTKTLVGLGVLPVIGYIFYSRRKEITRFDLLKTVGVFLVLILPWYIYNAIQDSNFLFHHFFEIGVRGQENNFNIQVLKDNLFYLQIGIGKWYKLFLIATILGIFHLVHKKKSRNQITLLFIWFIGFSLFLLSSKTEIWHLLPLYPVIALLIPISFLQIFSKKKNKFFWLYQAALLVAVSSITVFQFSQISSLLYYKEPVFSAEKDISIKAGQYSQIYLLETFYPAAVFYSQKIINPLHWHPHAYEQLIFLLQRQNQQNLQNYEVFIINKQTEDRLKKDSVNFSILQSNESYLIITGT